MKRILQLMRSKDFLGISAVLCIAPLSSLILAADLPNGPADMLAREFAGAPASSKPAVWWFWGESVTTDHGITQDLEALKRAGFGGVVVYEQLFTDRPDALKSLSPEWLARFRFAAAECARLGMTLEVNASNGYVAGGPWITPELGMQPTAMSRCLLITRPKAQIPARCRSRLSPASHPELISKDYAARMKWR